MVCVGAVDENACPGDAGRGLNLRNDGVQVLARQHQNIASGDRQLDGLLLENDRDNPKPIVNQDG